MAFPTTSILDNFNRADNTSLGANWSTLANDFGPTGVGVSSNQVYNTNARYSSYQHMYYNVATYGADCEVYMSIPTNPGVPDGDVSVCCRVKDPGTSTWDGYEFYHYSTSSILIMRRIDNAVATTLGANYSQAVSSGNKIGIEMIGSTITPYYHNGTSWSALATRTDSTYAAAGYLGFYMPGDDLTQRFDDFGGGTITTVTVKKLAALGVG